MHKFKKESLIDWAAYVNGKYLAMITKKGKNKFQIKFAGYEPQEGFTSFEQSKMYVRRFNFKQD